MSPSASSVAGLPCRPFVVLGNPDCPRVTGFQRALADLGLPPAIQAPWNHLLTGQITLPDLVTSGAIVRIESPGRVFDTERLLLARGADVPDPQGEYARLSCREALALEPERGRILVPRQWYLGFQGALAEVERQLAACPPHTLMNPPADILQMFDKPGCQALLEAAGAPVPRALGLIASYDELLARMRKHGCMRVFVKLAHGSSASGVVAYRTQGGQHQAVTTVEMARSQGALRLYNSRRIRTYRDPCEIEELIDALCRHRACAEEWIPKASLDGHAFDLRVVVIGGMARHAVARLSRSPLTNLHLLNERRPYDYVEREIGVNALHAGLRSCEQAMRCLPRSLYGGVDLLFAVGLRRHAIVELNAHGDLLPGTLHSGHDTYTAEILHVLTN